MSDNTYQLGFTPNSSMYENGLFVWALVGASPTSTVAGTAASPHVLQVDTGSCGIAIGIQHLSTYYQDAVRAQGSAKLLVTYLPSKNQMWGWWAKLPVTLFGTAPPDQNTTWNPADYPSTTVEVMVVDYVLLHGLVKQPFGGGMMGIGFHADPAAVLADNPLLSATVNGQALSAGYVLSPTGIQIGLTQANTTGFQFVPLQSGDGIYTGPNAELKISYDGQTVPLTCGLLMDTGVQEPMLFTESTNIPSAFWTSNGVNGAFVDGVEFSVAVEGGVCSYDFTLGVKSSFTPPGFMLMNRDSASDSLNTSIYLLGGYDYILDWDGKRMGFSPRT